MVDYTNQTINTTQNLPDWYINYLTPILQQSAGQLTAPYQQYTGPTVAGFNNDQQNSFQAVQNAQGAVTPQIQQSFDLTGQAAAVNSGAAGAQQFGQASGIFNNVAGANTAGISQPGVDQGTGYLQQAANGSSLAAANPYIQQSTYPTGLGAASPYLGQAAQSFNDPGVADSYMSPYTQQVTDRIAQLGARNLSENLLPQVSDQFIKAGQFGSAQQRDIVGRTVRDTNESVLGQQAQALESGYSQANQSFQADQARQAQLAGTAGGLGTSQQQILQSAGTSLGNLSATDLSRLAAAGVNIGNLGLGQAGVAGADLSRQLTAGQGLQGIGQANIQASQADASRQLAAGAQMGALAGNAQNLNFQQIAALNASGNQQQAQTQSNLDAAHNEFLNQQNYPNQQLANASNIIHGLPSGGTTTSNSQTGTPSPSVVSQVAGVGLGVAGLANSGVFKAKGGRVIARRKNHSYGNVPKRGIAFAEAA